MQSPRLFGWLIATLLLLAVIALLAPQQLPVSLYKLSLVTMAGVVGYWLDRSLFPYARPDAFLGPALDDGFDYCDPASTAALPPDEDAMGVSFAGGNGAAMAHLFALAMVRRALIVGCAMLAMGLGA